MFTAKQASSQPDNLVARRLWESSSTDVQNKNVS